MVSKTSERRKKWARIEKHRDLDSRAIATGRMQLPKDQPKGFAKRGGKAIVRAMHNDRYEPTKERLFSVSQSCWTRMPNWYKKEH